MHSASLAQTFDLALAHHRAGRLREAAALYGAVLCHAPRHAPSCHWLGLIALQENRPADAAELYRRAIAIDPSNPDVYSDLANALQRLGRLPDAVDAYRQALALRPDHALARYNLAQSLFVQGELEKAVAEFRAVLEFQPSFALAHLGKAEALAGQQRWKESEAAVCQALLHDAALAEAHRFLAHILVKLDRPDEAVRSLQTALQLQPQRPEWHHELAQISAAQSRFHDAILAERRAVQLRPAYVEALNGLALSLKALGQFEEAGLALRRGIAEQPDSSFLWANLAGILKNLGQPGEAVAAYRRGVALDPASPRLQSALIYSMYFDPASTAAAIGHELRLWHERFGRPVGTLPLSSDRSRTRRLRVGYVSPDFRDHVIARNLRPLFLHHDHTTFEIFCYSSAAHVDSVTREFQTYADQWRDCRQLDDDQLADSIRSDAIDVLVDLSQHMPRHRLGVFARKPAPVQASFAAYPAGTGLSAIEHRLTDRYLDPPVVTGPEQLHYLDSFWCYDPAGVTAAVNAPPSARNGRVTFGNLNNFSKINASLLRLWCAVLEAVPHSQLLLLAHPGSARDWVRQIIVTTGISPDRVNFVAPAGRTDYLAYYHQIDVVLDSFPYNGHTSSLDALWMGVPVITLAGETSVSRAGLSQLTNLGLSELIATTSEEFVRLVTELATNASRLAHLRGTLRISLEQSVLMNAAHFAEQIESSYRAMWLGWCTG